MTKEHEMKTFYSCEGHNIEGELHAECIVRLGPFKSTEQLTHFVLCMKPYLNEAVDKALKDAFGADSIRKGEEHVERYGNVQ